MLEGKPLTVAFDVRRCEASATNDFVVSTALRAAANYNLRHKRS